MKKHEFSLKEIRVDGWLEQVVSQNPGFSDLMRVLGERFVAYTLMVGVRITSVMFDEQNPGLSIIKFIARDGRVEHTLTFDEIRDKVLKALLNSAWSRNSKDAEQIETVAQYLGPRLLFLSTIEKIKLEKLNVYETHNITISYEQEGNQVESSVDELEGKLVDKIREELSSLVHPESMQLSLKNIEEAYEYAKKEDWDSAIMLLEEWFRPLSMIVRTADAQELSVDVRHAFANAMELLGIAYGRKKEYEAAMMAIRLAMKWDLEGSITDKLFYQLGLIALDCDQEGEGQAIGYFRRSLSLGYPKEELLPKLAYAYAKRGKYVAAMLCVDEASAFQIKDPMLDQALLLVETKIGPQWRTFKIKYDFKYEV